MDILQKHTDQFFGAMQHGIKRSGKVIYTARGGANSDLGLYANGQRVQRSVNYSRTTSRQVTAALRELGLEPAEVQIVKHQLDAGGKFGLAIGG